MMTDKLKPCPFCGGKARVHGKEYFFVYCYNCGAESDVADEKVTAIKSWNNRKPMDSIVEQLEEVAFQEDAPIYKGDVEIDSYLRLSKVIEIVKGVQNE